MAKTISIRTRKRVEMVEITGRVEGLVAKAAVGEGSCLVYCPHTTAGVCINENADPSVRRDIEVTLNRLVPGEGDYTHVEGNADSHVKAVLVGASETIPVENGRLALGRWQGIFFCEFDGPRERKVVVEVRG